MLPYSETDRNSTELDALLEITRSLGEYQNLKDLVLHIIIRIRSVIDADGISIILPNEKNRAFSFGWAHNFDPSQSTKLKEIRFPCNVGIAGSVYVSGKPEFIPDVESDPRHYQKVDHILGFATKSMIAVPLHGKEKIIGILEIINKRNGTFDERDVNLTTATAAVIGVALENALINADLKKTNILLKKSEAELKKHHRRLENLVEERTVKLRNANEQLRAEIAERKRTENERERLISELQDALSRVKMLSGMLPICANCKKIRDDKGYWNQIELYIKEHSEAEFSHGICPDCCKKLYPGFTDPDKSTCNSSDVSA